MKLRTPAKRKPTIQLLLSNEQARPSKKAKTSTYILRSKHAGLASHLASLTAEDAAQIASPRFRAQETKHAACQPEASAQHTAARRVFQRHVRKCKSHFQQSSNAPVQTQPHMQPWTHAESNQTSTGRSAAATAERPGQKRRRKSFLAGMQPAPSRAAVQKKSAVGRAAGAAIMPVAAAPPAGLRTAAARSSAAAGDAAAAAMTATATATAPAAAISPRRSIRVLRRRSSGPVRRIICKVKGVPLLPEASSLQKAQPAPQRRSKRTRRRSKMCLKPESLAPSAGKGRK